MSNAQSQTTDRETMHFAAILRSSGLKIANDEIRKISCEERRIIEEVHKKTDSGFFQKKHNERQGEPMNGTRLSKQAGTDNFAVILAALRDLRIDLSERDVRRYYERQSTAAKLLANEGQPRPLYRPSTTTARKRQNVTRPAPVIDANEIFENRRRNAAKAGDPAQPGNQG